MPRIPLVTEANMTEPQRRVYEAMTNGPRRSPPVGPLAAAMHRPDLAEKWSDLGLVLRFNSSFAPRLREFVILLTGRFWDCQFEWFSHEAEARKAGLSDRTIETSATAAIRSRRRTSRRSTTMRPNCYALTARRTRLISASWPPTVPPASSSSPRSSATTRWLPLH